MENVRCTYRISLKALIKDQDGRIMLLQDKNGDWELPGGGLEHGEKPQVALSREISEETGLKVDYIGQSPVAFWTLNKEVGSPTLKWFAFVVYEATASGTFKPDTSSDEAQKADYFSIEEIKTIKLHDNTKKFFSELAFN